MSRYYGAIEHFRFRNEKGNIVGKGGVTIAYDISRGPWDHYTHSYFRCGYYGASQFTEFSRNHFGSRAQSRYIKGQTEMFQVYGDNERKSLKMLGEAMLIELQAQGIDDTFPIRVRKTYHEIYLKSLGFFGRLRYLFNKD